MKVAHVFEACLHVGRTRLWTQRDSVNAVTRVRHKLKTTRVALAQAVKFVGKTVTTFAAVLAKAVNFVATVVANDVEQQLSQPPQLLWFLGHDVGNALG